MFGNDTLRIYTPKVRPYEFPELFEPVDLGLDDDKSDEEEKEVKYILPLVIEALPTFTETKVQFFVREVTEFKPNGNLAKQFKSVGEANLYIKEILKPRHPEKWTFVLWSVQALVN